MAYQPDCELGTSYLVDRGCAARAVAELRECGDAIEMAPCKLESPHTSASDFSRKIMNRQTQEKAMSEAAESTGSGWGVSMSAGVEYMSSHTSADTSVSFLVGKARQVKVRKIKYPSNLALTDAAKTQLKKDPVGFLNYYGGYFVESIVDGGSFIGTAEVTSLMTSSSNSLSTFAGLEFGGFLGFSASFQNSFDQAAAETAGTVDSEVKYQATGGTFALLQSEGINELQGLNIALEQWNKTVHQSPVPLLMNLQPWMLLVEVADYLSQQNESVHNLFTTGIAQATVNLLTAESWATTSTLKDVLSLKRKGDKAGCGILNEPWL